MQIKTFRGCPGAGKTHRLLQVMEEELANGVQPERLAYLTFTVAARAEAKERARSKFGFADKQLKWFKTLHAVMYELLGTAKGAVIGDVESLKDFAERGGYEFTVGGRLNVDGMPAGGFTAGDKLLAFDHFRRHRLLDLETAFKAWTEPDISLFEAKRFTEGYTLWKQEEGRLDFTDLLERGAVTLDCDVFIVDEAQDLSPLQWKVFWQLAQNAQRVYLAGDDDQAIYEWAGASPHEFLSQPGETELLLQSYRCPVVVMQLAKSVIEPVKLRQPKAWLAREAIGTAIYATSVEESEAPKTGSVLYLYRNHRDAPSVCRTLKAHGEVFEHQGKSSIPDAVVNAIVAWERIRKGKLVSRDHVVCIFNYTSLRNITLAEREETLGLFGPVTDYTVGAYVHVLGWVQELRNAPWYTVLDKLVEDEFYLRKVIQRGGLEALLQRPRIRLSTIHGAKGAEADHVVLLTDMSPLVRQAMERDPETERRVWYVGITRARETLTIVGYDNPLL